MNMKKTIAAIAAGAVAVSAMATTVSAVESKTLNYNLTNTLKAQYNGKVTLKATFPNVPLTAGQDVKIKVTSASGNGWNDKVVVSGQYMDTNKAINPITFSKDQWGEGYNAVTDGMMNTYTQQLNGSTNYNNNIHEITIPVSEVNVNGAPELVGTTGQAGASADVTAATFGGTAATAAEAAKISVQYTALPGDGTYTLRADNMVDGDGNPAGVGFFILGADGFLTSTFVGVDVSRMTAAPTPAAGDEITVVYTSAKTPTRANITVTATLNDINALNNGAVGGLVNNKTLSISIDTDGNGYKYGDASYSGVTAATRFKAPLMTNLSGNKDIITYLENACVANDDPDNKKSYVNVKAVLNDAVSNYEGVTFTFNTAASKIKYTYVDNLSSANPSIVPSGLYGSVEDATTAWKRDVSGPSWAEVMNYPNGGVIGVYNDDGTDAYMAFGEHTYDWNYAPEATGFTGYDWGGTNLFAGALIVNERLTMSLSNTEYFDWTKTSVSFDWEAIMDNAATTNNYATYIQTLKLATSNMWFWDSMDLVLTAGEADDVSADAGAEVDDATLDDEDDGEVIDGDEDEDPAPVDDDEDEDPAPVVDETPAPVVTNPPTGNASVALAVIPVALAAAAIVAKKRG